MPKKLYTKKELDDAVYEVLTIQLLRLRNEIFERGGISKETFTVSHFGTTFSEYEKKTSLSEKVSP